ncbi:type II secretion system F family protein [Streptomyces sp. NPDC052092]|uniref:type II secretion system F family protein n=1 Tax=Streptomyces sp. NPDC052092 TaxID=3365685 RepID=UPI0037D136C9
MNGATGTSLGAAVACLGAAAWLLGGGHAEARRVRALCAGGSAIRGGSAATGGGEVTRGGAVVGEGAGDAGPPGWPRVVRAGDRLRRLTVDWVSLAAGVVLAVLGASVLPVVAGAAGVPVLRRVRRAAADRRRRESRADAVIALCGALAGELRTGRQPGEALLPAVRDSGGLGDMQAAVLAAARFGGDVPDALAAAARQPGAEGLRGLAACWRVAVDQGAGLADGLDRLEAALRAERDQRADLRAQLAGARATAVMLAGLPVVGLALGAALGADPLHVLLHTPSGSVCLAVGGVLEGLGLWWVLRIMRGAEEAAS